MDVLLPNGWYPPVFWRIAPPWRAAKRASLPGPFATDGIPVRELSYRNPVPSRLLREPVAARVAKAITQAFAQTVVMGVDVFLVQFALPYGPSVRAAANRLGVPYAVYLRGDDVWIWPHRDKSSLTAFVDTVRDAQLVLSVSRVLLDEAQRLAEREFHSAAVVPNGIELERFRPPRSELERERARASLGIAAHETAIVSVGSLIVRKGWLELLDALGGVSHSTTMHLVVAAGSLPVEEVDLATEAKQRAPQVRVSVHRDLTHNRLPELYRAGDIFCLASHWEGMANSLLEAMATGLPCITTSTGGHAEVITSGVEGILVPPKDSAALRDAITRVSSSASLRTSLGHAARRRAESVGDSRKAAERLSALLECVRLNATIPPLDAVDPYARAHFQAAVE